MRPIPAHVVQAVHAELPRIVSDIRFTNRDTIVVPWHLVDERPELLYNVVWLATCHQKSVIIEAPEI